MTQEDVAITANHLTKTYRSGFWLNQKLTPLHDCSLTILTGETFGLLGPNGAGKTTLLKLLLGIVPPTSGGGTILGHRLGDRAAKQFIGYLPENAYYYDYLTGWELLDFVASIFGMGLSRRRQRIADLLDLVGLPQSVARRKQLREYSKGMVQRIGIAQSLLNDPAIVFLDEPMSGLDPVGRYQVREIILLLKKQNKTVFFNSHILSDAEVICDRVGILNRGELIALGTLNELLGTDHTYQVSGRGGDLEVLAPQLQQFRAEPSLWHGQLQGDPQAFLSLLVSQGATLVEMRLSRQSLEDFFIEKIRTGKHRENP